MRRRYPRRNQVLELAETDIILTVGGALLLTGFVYIVISALIEGTAQGLKQAGVVPASTTLGPGGSTQTLPEQA
jgi:hypothetical protein